MICNAENASKNFVAGQLKFRATRRMGRAGLLLLFAQLWLSPIAAWASQAETPQAPLPNAPDVQLSTHVKPPTPGPCQASRSSSEAVQAAGVGAVFGAGNAAAGIIPPGPQPVEPCPLLTPIINWYARFIDGPKVKPMTPKEKAWLAARSVADPFNGLTILASSAVAVGWDAHSPYGPGMPGFGRNVGVSYSLDITGEFFGVFLIPSIAHQDPRYHRLPHASIPHRVGHAILQVLWTQGDNGQGMVNYANVVGFGIEDELGNFYVPGQQTNLPASAERYGIGMGLAPIGNFVSEFWPDLASHLHVRVILVQWIINHEGKSGTAGTF